MLPRRIFKYYARQRRYSQFSLHHSTNFMHRFGRLLLLLLALVTVHTLAMMFFEAMSFGDALWLSLTTITTVGYGDFSAASLAGRVCSTLFIYSVGITLLAQLGAEYMEYRLTIREMKNIGRWKWKNMNDHILIINVPKENTNAYLFELITQIRQAPELAELPVQILCDNFAQGLPEKISDLGAVQYSGIGQNVVDLQAVNVQSAAYIIVLANDSSGTADSLTFDLLSRIQELECPGLVLAEVCQDENRQRMLKVGVNVMVRPMRAYPGLIVRTLIAPGTEAVFENLFSYSDDHMERFEHEFINIKWSDIVCRFVVSGLGTPMAYVSKTASVEVHPLPDALCSGSAIITMVNETQNVTPELIAQCLKTDETMDLES